ncbi:hypothetical protein MMPV_001064 [Pyropia vietnamensis]
MARSNALSLATVWAGAPAGLTRGGRATALRTCRRASTGSSGLAFMSSTRSSSGRPSWRRRSSSEVTSVTDVYTLPYPAPPPPRELSVPPLEALTGSIVGGARPPMVAAPAVNVHDLVSALSVGDEVRDASGALSLRGGGGGTGSTIAGRRLGVDGMGGVGGLRHIPQSDKLGLFVSLCSLLVSVQVLMPQIL